MQKQQLIIKELEFTIYGVGWIDKNHCIVGGGGGQGIPNKLLICNVKPTDTELNVVSELVIENDVVWSLSCVHLTKHRLIVFTGLTQIMLVQYDSKFKLSLLDIQPLFSSTITRGTKHVAAVNAFDSDWVVTCNDRNDLLVYVVANNKLQLVHTVITQTETKEAMHISKYFKHLDVRVEQNYLLIATITEDSKLGVWKVKHKNKKNFSDSKLDITSTITKLKDGKQRFKFCKFSLLNPNILYTMHTSRCGPTYVTTYDMKDLQERSIQTQSVQITGFGISHELDAKTRKQHNLPKLSREFLTFGVKSGIAVSEVIFDENQKVKSIAPFSQFHGAHVDAVTCDDLLLTIVKNQPVLKAATGSLDRSVGFTVLSARPKSAKSSGMIVFAVVLLVSILVSMLKYLLR